MLQHSLQLAKPLPLAGLLIAVLLLGQLAYSVSRFMTKYRKRVNVPAINLNGKNYNEAAASYINSAAFWLRKGRREVLQSDL